MLTGLTLKNFNVIDKLKEHINIFQDEISTLSVKLSDSYRDQKCQKSVNWVTVHILEISR